MDTHSGQATLSKVFTLPSEKRVFSKRKKIPGANSFLLEYSPLQKGFGAKGSEQEFTKIVSLV